jgi:hypothetical protein
MANMHRSAHQAVMLPSLLDATSTTVGPSIVASNKQEAVKGKD